MLIKQAYRENQDKHANHLEFNYDICKSMDATKFSIILEKLVKQGMSKEMAEIFQVQFSGLLGAVLSENNRLKTWMPLE
jgi:hypothetical protein